MKLLTFSLAFMAATAVASPQDPAAPESTLPPQGCEDTEAFVGCTAVNRGEKCNGHDEW